MRYIGIHILYIVVLDILNYILLHSLENIEYYVLRGLNQAKLTILNQARTVSIYFKATFLCSKPLTVRCFGCLTQLEKKFSGETCCFCFRQTSCGRR